AAAALALCEILLQGPNPNPEKALEALPRAVQGVTTPSDWKNSLVDLSRAREYFEQAQQAYRKAGRFDLALRVVGLYQPLALPNRAAMLQGEVCAEWGRSLLKSAQQLPPGEQRQRQEFEARGKLREAGAAYSRVAQLAPAEKESHIWSAACCLL